MNIPLDLFGQVPITRLELKRKLQQMGGRADEIISEIIIEKIALASNHSYFLNTYKTKRRLRGDFELRMLDAQNYYREICEQNSMYREKIKEFKRTASQKSQSFADQEHNLRMSNIRSEKLASAYILIAELDKKNRKLTSKHVRQLHAAKVANELIPWHLATQTAIDIGKSLNIYVEPSIPNFKR